MYEDHPSESGPDERYFQKNYLGKGTIAAAVLAILFAVVVGFVVFLGGPASSTTKSASGPAQTDESRVETARQGLSRQTDLNACRSALQQINTELGEKAASRPPALTNEQKDWLRANLQLDRDELSEVESSHYTRLDQEYLFGCFLMRDAAASAVVKGVRSKTGGQTVREKPLDQAVRAFAWVMREVRLRSQEGEAAPPSFVVRRGWGSGLERALVFLALLEQLGDPDADQPELLGFLLQVPDGEGRMRLWACGVVDGGGNEVYLFDPSLGLPLPGPKGEGVATLAQAREQADILAQLNTDKKYRYPVTKEQARSAQAQLVCPLSALSPRMRFLQDKLLAPAVRVRLGRDPAKERDRVGAACSAGVEKAAPVQLAKDKCTLLRRFLATDKDGAETASQEQRFQLALVPWNALHPVFQDEQLFPRKTPLGMRVLSQFASPFIVPTMEAGQPRDLLLRGRYLSAEQKLVGERDTWRSALAMRANSGDLQQQFRKWVDDAHRDYAKLLHAKTAEERQQLEQQVDKLWGGQTGLPVVVLLNSSVAAARNPEVEYQLGLCSQEQAEQLQARLDLRKTAGNAPTKPENKASQSHDERKTQDAWLKALDKWRRFEEDYPTHPDVAAALRLRGRAESMLGDHKAAIASCKKIAELRTSDLEKLAALYLAQQEQKQHAEKDK